MSGVAALLAALTEPGAGVVVNPPVYAPVLRGDRRDRPARGRGAARTDESRWELDLDALERAFADGAAAYLLCNPHNPTGRVSRARELAARRRARRATRRGRRRRRDPRAARPRRRDAHAVRLARGRGGRARAHAREREQGVEHRRAEVRASSSRARRGRRARREALADASATTPATSACSRRSPRSATAALARRPARRHLDANRRRLADAARATSFQRSATRLPEARLPRVARLPGARPRRRPRRGVPRARPGRAQLGAGFRHGRRGLRAAQLRHLERACSRRRSAGWRRRSRPPRDAASACRDGCAVCALASARRGRGDDRRQRVTGVGLGHDVGRGSRALDRGAERGRSGCSAARRRHTRRASATRCRARRRWSARRAGRRRSSAASSRAARTAWGRSAPRGSRRPSPCRYASVARSVRPSVLPMSRATSVYVSRVAPRTSAQRAPASSQRYHW